MIKTQVVEDIASKKYTRKVGEGDKWKKRDRMEKWEFQKSHCSWIHMAGILSLADSNKLKFLEF